MPNHRRFTPEQERAIAAEYIDCNPSTLLCKKWECDFDTILRCVRRLHGDVAVRTRSEAHRCSPVINAGRFKQKIALGDQLEAIRLYFDEGLSACKVGQRLDISEESVRLILREHGLPRRSRKIYSVDDAYFRHLGPARLRWLGFLASDGCVFGSGVRVAIGRQDREHLEAFRAAIRYTGPIYEATITRPTGYVVRSVALHVRSPEMVADLARHGVHPRKSLTLEPWAAPPGDEGGQASWWGGMMDGDGSLYKCRTGKWGIGLVGTEPVLHSYVEWVARVSGDPLLQPRRHSSSPSVWVRDHTRISTLTTIARLLYLDAGDAVPLARKARAAERMLAEFARR